MFEQIGIKTVLTLNNNLQSDHETPPVKEQNLGKTLDMRSRVHIPGKYFVFFVILPLLIIGMSVHNIISDNFRYKPSTDIQHRTNANGQAQAYYPMPELIVDLSPDLRGRVSYLKLVPSIALKKEGQEEIVKTIEAQKSVISERITLFLRALRVDDFEDTAQLNRIKRELTRRVNLGAGGEVAIDVVLEQLVIQ